METYHKYVATMVRDLIETGAVKATKYISPKCIIRAVRKRFAGKILAKHNVEVILTIGKPNYAERQFIKLCSKAKEPFPVKKVQLKFGRSKRKTK